MREVTWGMGCDQLEHKTGQDLGGVQQMHCTQCLLVPKCSPLCLQTSPKVWFCRVLHAIQHTSFEECSRF